ncbi:MAG: PAS domain S-box protein [Panacibacter sp.]
MKISPISKNETDRIAALHLFKILDTDEEQDFNDIVHLASQLCETPFSLITLIDENRQWFKARHGIGISETSRNISICAHAIHEPDIMVVTDASKDERFFDNPFVIGEPGIRFYAGVPLVSEDGLAVGTLCVLDQQPRTLTALQVFSLRVLAKQVVNLLKLRLKISDANAKLSAYFNSTTDAIFIAGPNYEIQEFNKVAQENILSIYNKYIQAGDCLLDYIDNSAKQLFQQHFFKALKGKEIHTETHSLEQGKPVWRSLIYLPLRNQQNETIAVAFTSTNITAQKDAEQKIKESGEQKEQIARLSEAVNRTENIEQIYELALDALQKSIGAHRASVLLFDLDGVMRFKASRSLSEAYLQAAEGHSPWVQDEKNAAPIFVPDATDEPSLKKLLQIIQNEGICALGFIPLVYHKSLIGKFMVYFNSVHHFSDEEIQLAQTISSLVAHAIGQKKSELDLRQSEKKYRDVINNVKEIIFTTDIDNKLTFLNPAWKEITGFTLEESIGKNLTDFVHPDDRKNSIEKYKALLNFETDHCKHDTRLVIKDGSTRWFEINKRLVIDDYNNTVGVTGILNDSTEHKKAEEALAENQRFLQTLINNLPGYVYRVKNNPDYTPEYISEGVVKITGHTADEYLVHKTVSGSHSIAESDKERIWNEVQKAITLRLPYEFTYRMGNTTGEEKWVWERGQGIWNDDGELIATEGFITDINDRKKAEDALQKSEDNLRTVFTNTEVGYVLISADLKVLSFNKPAAKFTYTEYQNEVIEGSYLIDYFPEKIHDVLKRTWQAVLNGQIVEYDRSMLNINGKDNWYHIKYSPVSNKQNKTVGIVMSIENITERKKAEIELNKSFSLVTAQNKRLVNFSYIVSHNLRSHATNIKSILGLMEESVSENERKQMMQYLKTVSDSLDETLYNLHEVISIQNNVNLIFEPLNLCDYINKALSILSEFIAQKNGLIKTNVSKEIIVNYNPAYLESILLNFLSNAVKYSHPQRIPVITMDCFFEGNKPVLVITDNGIGIDLKRNGDKLFGMYKTFHGNADARGIGLFITKNQVDFMGGRVEVESEVNVGTTFKIYF